MADNIIKPVHERLTAHDRVEFFERVQNLSKPLGPFRAIAMTHGLDSDEKILNLAANSLAASEQRERKTTLPAELVTRLIDSLELALYPESGKARG